MCFKPFFFNFIYLLLATLGLRCCARAFSSCGERGLLFRCGSRASHCSGFSCCGARAPGAWAPVVVARGLSSCGSQALERRLSSCGSWAELLRGMRYLPGPGLEPVSPALAGGFLTTAPPGKPWENVFYVSVPRCLWPSDAILGGLMVSVLDGVLLTDCAVRAHQPLACGRCMPWVQWISSWGWGRWGQE